MTARLFAALVVLAGCSVSLVDPAGRACDETHPCAGGRVCSAGHCVVPGGAPSADASAVPITCSRVAAPNGSDANAGTVEAPFATVGRLVDTLGPGTTACLRAGTYAGDTFVTKGGVAGALATLRSYPGERAKLVGRFLIASTATYFALSSLDVDGTHALGDSSPVVLATDVILEDSDFTSSNKDGCIRLGDPDGPDASRAIVRRNRIHRCGITSTNSGSGVKLVKGSGMRVEDNVVFDNPDHGLLFYPAAQGAVAVHNVLDGNRVNVLFGGAKSGSANDNVVERNVIAFPSGELNVTSYYDTGASIGQRNFVRRNCLFGGSANGGVPTAPQGFSLVDNVVADPAYVDRAAKDFRLGGSSGCRAVVEGS